MFRGGGHRIHLTACFPRARGDVPHSAWRRTTCTLFSPRTRGCSGAGQIRVRLLVVFPAHAGMFLFSKMIPRPQFSFPRARGDVPFTGCTLTGTQLFSPRTRGCSCGAVSHGGAGVVFPAHAGMFRVWPRLAAHGIGFPRARGDVPAIFGGDV